ncbi:hypothetical protein OG884_32040 [Streptosporangium sp. NBC_01755]|uniref:hypothetical protein n=1 Tax=unclassified Streptosporangium TaxID=2632669 RepID=UPI002DD8CC90|nr:MULTISPECIES: hypothetical protein [unclassified Streptosporangium]WSA29146.1 hypothetical protein OIE13_15455 [Streptosporangium sp. NBC_01810]WSC99409.1 hypothetical protein OG884_32040 [Streptosporangium sp. NBC_01755]
MTLRVLLASLAAGTVVLPVPAGAPAAAAEDLTIRSVTLRPANPVVGPADAVRMVIEVVARGVTGPEGVTIKVEPGATPASKGTSFPVTASRPGGRPDRGPAPATRPGPGPALAPGPVPGPTVSARLASGAVGRTEGTAPFRPGEGWETWRFAPEKSLSRWYPAGPWTVSVTARGADGAEVTGHRGFLLKRLTRFGGVQAVRGGSGVRVTGALNRVDPQGHLDYAPFPGQPVEIMHRAGKDAGWTKVADATTDAHGRFTRAVAGRTGGEWRLRFQGTTHYAPRLGVVHKVSPR